MLHPPRAPPPQVRSPPRRSARPPAWPGGPRTRPPGTAARPRRASRHARTPATGPPRSRTAPRRGALVGHLCRERPGAPPPVRERSCPSPCLLGPEGVGLTQPFPDRGVLPAAGGGVFGL